jgi:hypothetical protein
VIVPVKADREARGVFQEQPRDSRGISPEVVRDKSNCGVEIVLLSETQKRFEIQKPITLSQKGIIYDDRSIGFAWTPTLVAGHISKRHRVGYKPGKVLGERRLADLSVQVRDVLTANKQDFYSF